MTAASSVLVARFLGATGFGELGIVRATANLFTVYAGFRLGATANKHLAEFRESDPDRAGRILRMSLFTSAIFCALAAAILIFGGGHIAAQMLSNPELSTALRIAGVFLFFQAYSSVRETILIGTENFRYFAIVNVLKGVLTAVLIVPGAWLWGTTGAVAGLALAAFLTYLMLQYFIVRTLREFSINENPPFREWRRELPLLWTYALPGLLTGAVAVTVMWWGRTVLAGAENGYFELGLFEAANQWRTMILFLPAILARVAMPILSETYVRDRGREFLDAVALQFRAILIITLPLTVGVILFSDWLMLIFGEEFAESATVLPLLMVSVFLFALNQSLRKVQDGTGKRWQNLAIQLLWACAFVAVVWHAGAQLDGLTLAWAFLVSELVMLLCQLAYVEIMLARRTLLRILPDMTLSTVAVGLSVLVQGEPGELFAPREYLMIFALGLACAPAIVLAVLNLGWRHRDRPARTDPPKQEEQP